MLLGILGTGYFLPLMIKTVVSHLSMIGMLTMVPALAAVIGMLSWTRFAQASGRTEWHVAAGAILGTAGLVAAACTSSPVAAFAGIIMAFVGLWSAFAIFWALATTVLAGPGSAAAIALISAVGSLSGVFGPPTLGWLLQATGGHRAGILAMATGAALAGITALTFRTASTMRDAPVDGRLRAELQ